MAREKGCVKYGGRKKGTPNKVNKELKDTIKLFLTTNFEKFQEMWNGLPDESEKKFDVYLTLLKYVVPIPKAEDESSNNTSAISNTLDRIERGGA